MVDYTKGAYYVRLSIDEFSYEGIEQYERIACVFTHSALDAITQVLACIDEIFDNDPYGYDLRGVSVLDGMPDRIDYEISSNMLVR